MDTTYMTTVIDILINYFLEGMAEEVHPSPDASDDDPPWEVRSMEEYHHAYSDRLSDETPEDTRQPPLV
mgnify:CR=1 FL=1